MIKLKSYDLKSILILSLFNIVLIFFAIMIYWSDNKMLGLAHIIILSIFIVNCLLQIVIYLVSLNKLIINYDGVHILKKSTERLISWDKIKLYTYYNEVLLFEPHTLKILVSNNNEKKLLLGNNYSNIHISLKKYKKTLKFIPKNILENNKLFLYETEYLYEKDKYKLQKK